MREGKTVELCGRIGPLSCAAGHPANQIKQITYHTKWKTTTMEDDHNRRRLQWKTTTMEDHQNGRRPKWKTTKMEDDQKGKEPNGL